jgi:hypothetical protein
MSGVMSKLQPGELGVARALLDVGDDAGRREIDAAWKELLACVHPDTASNERLRTRLDGLTKRVNRARDVLLADLEDRSGSQNGHRTAAARVPLTAERTDASGGSLVLTYQPGGRELTYEPRPTRSVRARLGEVVAAWTCILVLALVAVLATRNSSAGSPHGQQRSRPAQADLHALSPALRGVWLAGVPIRVRLGSACRSQARGCVAGCGLGLSQRRRVRTMPAAAAVVSKCLF